MRAARGILRRAAWVGLAWVWVLNLACSLTCSLACSSAWAGPVREIVLGAPSSLTTLEGRESLEAVRLAVSEINSNGGVKIGDEAWQLRVAPFDLNDAQPGLSPAKAVERLSAFLRAEKPHALVIGPFRSEVLLASMDLLAVRRIPTLACIAMSPAVDAKILGDPKYRYIFRVSLNTKYLAGYLIEAMKLVRQRFGFTKVFIMNQDVAWARSTASLMIRLYFDRYGWRVLGQENLPHGEPDFRPLLQKARDMGGQVILAIFDMPGGGGLIRQWHDLGSRAMLCGFISPASGPDAWQAFGGRLNGVVNVIFELGNLPAHGYHPATAFYRAFRARYGRSIQAGHGPAPAYDSVYILAKALERAGSLDPDRVVAALEATDHRGVMGRVRFHRGHQAVFGRNPDQEALAAVVQWVRPGVRRIVFPAAIAEGDLLPGPFTPPWH